MHWLLAPLLTFLTYLKPFVTSLEADMTSLEELTPCFRNYWIVFCSYNTYTTNKTVAAASATVDLSMLLLFDHQQTLFPSKRCLPSFLDASPHPGNP